MAREGIGLGNAAGVWKAGLAEVGVHDIVARTVGRAPSVFIADLGERRVGQVILFTWFNSEQNS